MDWLGILDWVHITLRVHYQLEFQQWVAHITNGEGTLQQQLQAIIVIILTLLQYEEEVLPIDAHLTHPIKIEYYIETIYIGIK